MQIPALIPACTAAVLGSLLASPLAFAANGEQTPLDLDGQSAKAAAEVGGGGGALVRTIVGLAIVIGVIYGLTWVLRQLRASREGAAEGGGLASLATLPLGPNRSLHLVRAGEEIVLVGAAEHGVTPIRTYSEAEARALGLLDDGGLGGGGAGGAAADAFGAGTAPGGGRVRRALQELQRRTVIK
jgi:flagellar protein FliO/FliZ